MTELSFRGITYRQIALADCLDLGRALQAAGGAWHSHVLSPGCSHNPFDGHYAIVIEDDATGTPHIAEGGTAFPEVDKQLVKMLHGDDILDAAKAVGGAEVAKSSRLLAHVMTLQEAGLPWHHHMHFPGCAFNPHPGRWAISVESPDCQFAEAFAAEPVAILREVEVIYFGNLDRVRCCK